MRSLRMGFYATIGVLLESIRVLSRTRDETASKMALNAAYMQVIHMQTSSGFDSIPRKTAKEVAVNIINWYPGFAER